MSTSQLNIDIKPLPDLWFFGKKMFSPFEERALKADLQNLGFALGGIVGCFVLSAILLSESIRTFTRGHTYLSRWQRVNNLALEVFQSLGYGLFALFTFMMSPLYLLRFVTRSVITMAVGWGPSVETMISDSIQKDDLNALRHVPRVWFAPRYTIEPYKRLYLYIPLLILKKQSAMLAWVLSYRSFDARETLRWWDLVCQTDDSSCAKAFLFHFDQFGSYYYYDLGIAKFFLAPALRTGARAVVRAIADHYPPIENRAQYSVFTQRRFIDYSEQFEALFSAVLQGGVAERIDWLSEFGLLKTREQQERVLCGVCEIGRVELFASLLQRFDFPMTLSQSPMLYYACASPTVDLFHFLVERFGFDPELVKTPTKTNIFGLTPLDEAYATGLAFAIVSGSSSMVRYLIEEMGLDTQKVVSCIRSDSPGSLNALQMACRSSRINSEVVLYCLRLGYDLNERDPWGATPFTRLLDHNHEAMPSTALLLDLLSVSPNLKRKVPVSSMRQQAKSNGLLLLLSRYRSGDVTETVLKRYLLQADHDTLLKSFQLILKEKCDQVYGFGQRIGVAYSLINTELQCFLRWVPWMIDPFRQLIQNTLPGFLMTFDELVQQYEPQPTFGKGTGNVWAQLFHRRIGCSRPSTFTREMVQGYSGLSERQVDNRPS